MTEILKDNKAEALEFIDALRNLIEREEDITMIDTIVRVDKNASYDFLNNEFKVSRFEAVVEFNLSKEVTLKLSQKAFKIIDSKITFGL